MLSPRSRGKGSRSVPWRDGGKGKQKAPAWRKRATHAVDELSELPDALMELSYPCPSGRSPAEGIYLFDRQIARTGIRYHAELLGSRFSPIFTIRIPVESAAMVTA